MGAFGLTSGKIGNVRTETLRAFSQAEIMNGFGYRLTLNMRFHLGSSFFWEEKLVVLIRLASLRCCFERLRTEQLNQAALIRN